MTTTVEVSGAAAVLAAHDPMIELARTIDEESRTLRKNYEAEKEIEQQAQAVIGKARYDILGASTYPDAKFTLRLAYGTVKGYEENGAHVAPLTTIAGLYQRSSEHGDKEPFDLPQSWVDRRADVNMDTPMDFVTDCDIIGGNSGSPTVNGAGEFVGIIFDGNIESLPGDLAYDGVQSRSVSTDSAAILEALRKVYRHAPGRRARQRPPLIQSIAFVASPSKARTQSSRCSSLVSSILLWLIPWRLWTNIMTVGTPARAASAASWRGPDGSRWARPHVSRIDASQSAMSSALKRMGSIRQIRSHETDTFPSSANRPAASRAARSIRASAAPSRCRWSSVIRHSSTTLVTMPGLVVQDPIVQTPPFLDAIA